MAAPYSITPQALFALIGKPGAPVIVDVCLDEDHALDPRVIPGAIRMGFAEAVRNPEFRRDGPCVVVCQKGLKLSQGVAGHLRALGRDALYLAGGMIGWADAGLPAWPTALAPQIGQNGSFWAISDTPTARDIHLAWVTARLIDPTPLWSFVARDQIDNVAARFDAGTRVVAVELSRLDTRLRARLARVEAMISNETVAQILRAHCNSGLPSGKWLEQIFPMIDAMWVCAREAEQ